MFVLSHAQSIGIDDRAVMYWLWSRSGELLYIGITNKLSRRLKQHAREKVWYDDVYDVSVDWFTTMADAAEAEAWAVCLDRPKYNDAHSGYRLVLCGA